MAAPASGWYRLPKSGHPYFGPVPDGAEQIDAPSGELVEEPVASVDGSAEVGPDVLVDQEPAQPDDVVTTPADGAPGQQLGDSEVKPVGQRKRR